MRGLYLERGELRYRDDLPEPMASGESVIVEPLRAGICATDIALSRGYMDFAGVPGHEFVGIATSGKHEGQRVVGDINAGCGRPECDDCAGGASHHCVDRTVLGILNHSGAFAERLALPERNLLAVPDTVSSDAATFTEPLAAALEIGEQVELTNGATALVAGDGKLGLLCAHVLHLHGLRVTVAGRHRERQELLPAGVEHRVGMLEPEPQRQPGTTFDVAVEATGHAEVLARLIPLVRPRGTLVLKTTSEQPATVDLSLVTVNELTVVGSRCGPMRKALDLLARGQVPVAQLIHARFPLQEGRAAFARAQQPGVLKVLLTYR
ncbi:MAG: alcohol dehydrogenase catalytic domain-containing protein [Planctomycetota bacterium]|jgi:threonine dehydrogenase-like Zn-dependent dehydrogenase